MIIYSLFSLSLLAGKDVVFYTEAETRTLLVCHTNLDMRTLGIEYDKKNIREYIPISGSAYLTAFKDNQRKF